MLWLSITNHAVFTIVSMWPAQPEDSATLINLFYSNVKDVYTPTLLWPLSQSDHSFVLMYPWYRYLVKRFNQRLLKLINGWLNGLWWYGWTTCNKQGSPESTDLSNLLIPFLSLILWLTLFPLTHSSVQTRMKYTTKKVTAVSNNGPR